MSMFNSNQEDDSVHLSMNDLKHEEVTLEQKVCMYEFRL